MARKKTASKEDVNKSAEIRNYLAGNPDAKPSQVVAALKTHGINVTPAYVSSIKSVDKSDGKTPRKKRAGQKRAGHKRGAKDTSPVQDVMRAGELLFQAVDLVMKAGYKEAKTLVDVAGRMVNRIAEKKKE